MTTTLTISPATIVTGASTGQFSANGNPLIQLLAIGDVVEFQFSKREQLSGLAGWNSTTTGETGTRTLAWQFRWRNNGSFSSWATLTTGNISAISPDEDQPFYLEVRATRGGSDATGIIAIYVVAFDYTFNRSAVSGHGALVDLTLQRDLFDLFAACIQFKMPTSTTGRDRIMVVDSWPQGQSNKGNTIPIYWHDLRTLPSRNTLMGGSGSEFRFQVRMTVKTVGQSKGDLIQGAPTFDFVLGIIRRLFDSTTYHVDSYDVTFKGIQFLDMRLRDFGIYNFELEDRGSYLENSDTSHEFLINFAIETQRIYTYGYSSL